MTVIINNITFVASTILNANPSSNTQRRIDKIVEYARQCKTFNDTQKMEVTLDH